ncbi:hypothetical protein ACIBSV_35705 [Embleya sp. NPDC050154]|uniref:hypothetical protein n=1 Tax=unclassified Embleya TaxID=2699296 RepID=UPI00379757BC
MSKAKTRLATAAIGGMLVAGGTGMVVLAPAAQAADSVKVNMTCQIPYPPGSPDVTADFNIAMEVPTGKTAPGGEATVKMTMGATPVNGPVSLPDPVDFTATFDAKASGGSTQTTKIVGESGKIQVTEGQPITLPPFNAKIKVPSDATGDIDITPTKLVLNAAGAIDVPCTVNGTPKLGTIKVDAGGTPPPSSPPPSSRPPTSQPPTSQPPTTEPPGTQGPPNGKEVNVDYACKTKVEDFPVNIPDTTATYGVTITVPSTAKKGDKVDISAKFKDNLVGKAPAGLPGSNIDLKFIPTFTIDVEEGSNKRSLDLTGPEKALKVNSGDPLTLDGPITGKFDVWGGGDFSFKPGQLKISTNASLGTIKARSTTTCTVTNTSVSATLKASGDQGTPPPTLTQSPTGNVGSNGGSSGGTTGDLANTGASGGGMTAFAMAAGTAVLGAIALMLFVPYRRRIRNQV